MPDFLTHYDFAPAFPLFLLVVASILAAAYYGLQRNKPPARSATGSWTYYASPRTYLLTKSEAAFEIVLRGILTRTGKDHWRIHSQVAMSALVDPIASRRPAGHRGLLIPPWCLDYVLTERGRIKAIIELNDRSHLRADRKRRDANLSAGCARLRIPLLFVKIDDSQRAETWLADL